MAFNTACLHSALSVTLKTPKPSIGILRALLNTEYSTVKLPSC
ncbi:hypothetical protein UUU_16760 [Klebsiella pneumoniae subsp. pneumoniae DSM 30104 = JCM 1662 = NBRC 14940]|nr:hypothetical protein UUU_16760 [Klebsiella pneumoniae subsp. pneumoniae DSM 30104 = JCM 1662 = NBRC 14940]